jgi:ribosomal protein S18 acetylase RimI-like enzyme
MIGRAHPTTITESLPDLPPATSTEVRVVAGEPDWRRARALILDYLEWLAAASGINALDAQDELAEELADLPGWYTPPAGVLLLATVDGEPAGVVGVRAHAEGWAEMKRLYVRPAGRSYGLGERLVRAALTATASLGCHSLRLETAPGLMDHAIALYRRLGFRPTTRFGDTAVDGLLYLERPVDRAATSNISSTLTRLARETGPPEQPIGTNGRTAR